MFRVIGFQYSLARRSCANLDMAKSGGGDVDNLPKMGEGSPTGGTDADACCCCAASKKLNSLSPADLKKEFDSFINVCR